jgi:hypothetical protein
VNWSNWATVASLATAFGTLILAIATFSAVKSANLTAKVAQQSLLVGLRPVLMASRRDDPTQKVKGRQPWTVELLYGDHEGGQRCVTRFTMLPRTSRDPDADPEAELGWVASQSRHWNIDRPDPR